MVYIVHVLELSFKHSRTLMERKLAVHNVCSDKHSCLYFPISLLIRLIELKVIGHNPN